MDSRGISSLTFEDPSLPLAVVVASTRWDEPPRMRHGVAGQLMRWFNVLFVEFFPGEPLDGQRVTWYGETGRLIVFSPVVQASCSPRRYVNDPLAHWLVNKQWSRRIANAAKQAGAQTVLLFNFAYQFPEIMRENIFDYKIYVCNDEFPGRNRPGKPLLRYYQRQLLQHYEAKVARRADLCLTPHYPLREKLGRYNERVEMFFHGHNFEVLPASLPRAREEPIRVGYAGFLNRRLLGDWLRAVAAQGDMVLHLIGPVEDGALSDILAQPRVKYHPPQPEQELFRTLIHMDVLVMPFDPSLPEVAILSLNNKIFQYIASYKPIVMTDLPHFIELPDGVFYRAREAREFVSEIRRAFKEDCKQLVEVRRRIAMKNTWDQRGDQLASLLKDALPRLEAFLSLRQE